MNQFQVSPNTEFAALNFAAVVGNQFSSSFRVLLISLALGVVCVSGGRMTVKAQDAFQVKLGNPFGCQALSVSPTIDGGMIVGGWYDVGALFASQLHLAKLSSAGDTSWIKTYGELTELSTGRDGTGNIGQCVIQTADSGYFLIGETHSYGAGSSDIFALRLTETGDTLWSRTVGTLEAEHAQSGVELPNGDLLIAGFTESTSIAIRDVYLVCFDPKGNLRWTKTLGGASIDACEEVHLTPEGDLLLIGYTFSFGSEGSDVFVLKSDTAGDVIWEFRYGGASNDFGYAAAMDEDGNYLICGATQSDGQGDEDVLIMKIDKDGALLWSKTYGGPQLDNAQSITRDGDHFVVGGFTRSYGSGAEDALLIEIDGLGDTIWTRAVGGDKDDYVSSLARLADGRIAFAGHTQSFGAKNSDILIGVFDNEAIDPCNATRTSLIVDDIGLDRSATTSSISTLGKSGIPEILIGSTLTNVTRPCQPSSIEMQPGSNPPKVYPNPTRDKVWLPLSLEFTGFKEVMVIDLSGRLVARRHVVYGEPIDLHELPAGMYRLLYRTQETLETVPVMKVDEN